MSRHAKSATDPVRRPASVLNVLSQLESAALLETVIDGMAAIEDAPQRRLEAAGVEDSVIDMWNELNALRGEVRAVFLWRFFEV